MQFQEIFRIILDAYILWLIVFFILSFFLGSKRVFKIFLIVVFVIGLTALSKALGLKISYYILNYVSYWIPLFVLIILSPDIRRNFETAWIIEGKDKSDSILSRETINSIIEAAMFLSSQKIGALITIERYNSLDQYASKAIPLNAVVTKELLINIFTPNTPLHDGAVIIKENSIRAAAAYYVPTEESKYEKTMGSRHRAALGISEVTDSVTVVVSEETGNISTMIDGVQIATNSKEKLYEYLNFRRK